MLNTQTNHFKVIFTLICLSTAFNKFVLHEKSFPFSLITPKRKTEGKKSFKRLRKFDGKVVIPCQSSTFTERLRAKFYFPGSTKLVQKIFPLFYDFMQHSLKQCNNLSLNFIFFIFLNILVLGKARLTYSTSNIKLIVPHQKSCAESSSILCLQHTVRENIEFVLMRSWNVSTLFVVLDKCFRLFCSRFHLSFLCRSNSNNLTWSLVSDDVRRDFYLINTFTIFAITFFCCFCFSFFTALRLVCIARSFL